MKLAIVIAAALVLPSIAEAYSTTRCTTVGGSTRCTTTGGGTMTTTRCTTYGGVLRCTTW
jgi:hypothetical protein